MECAYKNNEVLLASFFDIEEALTICPDSKLFKSEDHSNKLTVNRLLAYRIYTTIMGEIIVVGRGCPYSLVLASMGPRNGSTVSSVQ